MAVSVYKKGFNAELNGRISTAVHAYISPDISAPRNAMIPEIRKKLKRLAIRKASSADMRIVKLQISQPIRTIV